MDTDEDDEDEGGLYDWEGERDVDPYLLDMVERFLDLPSAAEHLDAMVGSPGNRADLIEALLSLAHKRRERPATAHA
jgi:hypothetical protein